MKTVLAVILAALTLGSAWFAQGISPAETTEWKYSKQDDPLHGTSFEQFVLDGKYLTPPSVATKEQPGLVVHCSNGKFKEGFLIVGGVAQYASSSGGGVAHSIKGATQAHVEMRWDDKKKPDSDWWEISNDGQALSFDKIQLTKLMTGHLLGHPGDPSQLVHRQILGVVEAFGNQVVMQFDMPQDDTQIVETCGLEWGKNKKRH
jgi:hypothetical protein